MAFIAFQLYFISVLKWKLVFLPLVPPPNLTVWVWLRFCGVHMSTEATSSFVSSPKSKHIPALSLITAARSFGIWYLILGRSQLSPLQLAKPTRRHLYLFWIIIFDRHLFNFQDINYSMFVWSGFLFLGMPGVHESQK